MKVVGAPPDGIEVRNLTVCLHEFLYLDSEIKYADATTRWRFGLALILSISVLFRLL